MTASPELSRLKSRIPAVKICGLRRREDAEAAARAGADYLGVVLVPGTPRALEPESAREVLKGLPVPVVAVVADSPLDTVVEAAGILGAGVIQLHGREPPEFAAEVAAAGPWKVWKSVRVREVDDVRRGLDAYGEAVDGLLLDGWHPALIGGSGASFSWSEIGRMRSAFPEGLDLIAAGGLTPSNVEEAVRRLTPEVVDVSSGVEVGPGVKSPEMITGFIRNAKSPESGRDSAETERDSAEPVGESAQTGRDSNGVEGDSIDG
jgi:phosphoribosylanthranilate isomerase